MSQSVSPYLILDDRLNISDHVGFGVMKSGMSVNQQVFTAAAPTTSSVNLNCLIPSLSVVIDRQVKLTSQFTIQITCAANKIQAGQNLINYPANFNFANFTFSQLINNLSVQVNNSTLNQNYQDSLPLILRNMSADALQRWADFTPITPDYYQATAQTGTLSQFKNITEAPSQAYLPRGTFRVDNITQAASVDATQVVASIQITVCEPFFVSPFLSGDAVDHHNAGLTGVSAINFNLNLDTTAARAVRFLNSFIPFGGGAAAPIANEFLNISLKSVDSFNVLMTFLSPSPSQMIPMTSIVPYYELPTFKTTYNTAIPANSTATITSVVIAPNSIPDKVFLAVRPSVGSVLANATNQEFYLPIERVNITWNNNSGLLASATQQDLYYMSKKAGIKMDYLQWSGRASGTGTSATSIPLTGGIVALDFGDMIPIMEEYYAAGSLGTWNFSASVVCRNTTGVNITQPVELIVCFQQSGVFSTTSGVSSQYVGVLSKDTVLSVSQQDPITKIENTRMIGGYGMSDLFNSVKTIAGSTLGKELLKKGLTLAREKLGEHKGKYEGATSLAEKGLKSLGFGKKPRVKGGVSAY